MKIMSLTLCGLGESTKLLGLRHLIHWIRAFIILIPETLTDDGHVISYFHSISPNWNLEVF